MKNIEIAPSVLSADFSDIKQAIYEIENSGCKYVHLDVMDGTFVPEITFGSKFIKDIRSLTNLTFDVHLMIDKPENHIDSFVLAGSDIITIHQEATLHLHRVLSYIKSKGIKAGVSIIPSTPVSAILPVLDLCDEVLIMTVNPGYGGQKLIQSCVNKIAELAEIREKEGYDFIINCDGGVNLETIQDVVAANVDLAVVGSAFFNADDKTALVADLKELASQC